MKKEVILWRTCPRKTPGYTIKAHIAHIVKRGFGNNRGKNWDYKLGQAKCERVLEIRDRGHRVEGYKWYIPLIYTKVGGHLGNVEAGERQWRAILSYIRKACKASKFGEYPWYIEGEDEYESIYTADPTIDEKPYAELNISKDGFYDHIFDRDAQIDIVLSALICLSESNLSSRNHVLLTGPPGSGKSEILECTANMLGEEKKEFYKLDMTSTTQAGAEKFLLETAQIPPVLIAEEIEKTNEASLRWLLAVLDKRGEVRKTNFRIGQRARNVKMLCLATVNDVKLLRKLMSGALYSRFTHEVYCPRPTRPTLRQILKREIDKYGGDESWIEPTLDFCVEEHIDFYQNDPRKIISVCLCGRDKLLTGEYQKALDMTMPPDEEETELTDDSDDLE